MLKKIIIGVSLFIILSVGVGFCNDTISVGYYDDYPLVFQNDQGEPAGFLVEIFNDYAKNNNLSVSFEHYNWSNALDALQQDQIDVLLDIVYTENRDKIYDFNEEILVLSWGKLAAHRSLNIENILDLEGMRIGYLADDYYALSDTGIFNQLKDFKVDVKPVPYLTYAEVMLAMEEGQVDVGILNRLVFHKIYDYNNLKEVPLNFSANGLLMATNEGKNAELLNDFDQYIKKEKLNGDSFYYERYQYWFNEIERSSLWIFYHHNRNYIFLAGLLFVLTIIISRIQVKVKSEEISEANRRLAELNALIEEDKAIINEKVQSLNETVSARQSTAFKFEKLISFIASKISKDTQEDALAFLKALMQETMTLVDPIDQGVLFYEDEMESLGIYYKGEKISSKNSGLNLHSVFYASDQLQEIFNVDTFLEEKNLSLPFEVAVENGLILMSICQDEQVIAGMIFEVHVKDFGLLSPEDYRVLHGIKRIGESYFINESYNESAFMFQKELVYSLVKMLEIHDDYTKGHSEKVANMAKNFAEYLGFSKNQVEEIYWAALLHDVGKILIDEKILRKKEKLTIEEEEIVRKHSLFGYAALNQSQATSRIAEFVLAHHERYDGEGYPYGLKGDEIPKEAHIIFLADTYDAMASDRAYKKGLSKEKIIKEIKENLGSQYDPTLGQAFIDMLKNQ